MRKLLVALVAVLAMLLSAGCASHSRFGHDPAILYSMNHSVAPPLQPGRYGGALSGAFLSDPKTFNLWTADDADSTSIVGVLYDTLETRDSYTLKYIPRLAYLPKISADGRTYTYTLRPGLRWSDGQPITADDVIFTLNVLFDPKIDNPGREGMLIDVPQRDGTTKHEPFRYLKIDDRTVQFTLPFKWAPAQEIFGFNLMPEHVLEPIYKAGQFNSAWNTDTPPSQLVASGPYVIEKFVPGQRIVFKRNPYFWRNNGTQHLPYLDEFHYMITPDTNAMVLTFRSGESDSVDVPIYEYPSLARYAKRDNYTVIDRGPDWGFSYFCFNLNPNSIAMKKEPDMLALFSNVQFRQACSYAIDRNTICNSVGLGLYHPLWGPISPADSQYYDPNVKQYPFNPAKARQMLLAIGLTPGANGQLLWRGKPVKFNILTNVENQSRKAMATIISNDLRNIGLDAQFTPVNFNDLIRRLDSPPYDWEASVMGFIGGPEPNDASNIWRSGGHDHQWWPQQKQPATVWEARIDQDFGAGARELDPKKRKKYYDDWQETLGHQQAFMFIMYYEDYTAMRNHYGNIKPSPFYSLGGDVYWNMEEVYDTHVMGYTP